jgi:putative transposase
MAHPARKAGPRTILSSARVFFVTTKTSMRGTYYSPSGMQHFIDVLRLNVAAGKFQLHDFVIMPNHLHLLMTLPADKFGYQGEVWQRGFSEVRINDRQSFLQHREYIARNPVKAGLADLAE